MSIGSLAGAGTLGLLMPPSIILIVYGVTINESIPKLFMAGIGPAIALALLFVTYVVIWSLVNSHHATIKNSAETSSGGLASVLTLLPLTALIGAVLGSIYFGFLTATEAAVLGVLGALLLSRLDGTLSVRTFVEGVEGALKMSCMIALILAGSATVTLSMGYTGIPRGIAETISTFDLTSGQLLLLLGVFYIILGMFVDGISAVVLTMAVIEPMIRQAGIDPIWFGVFLVILVETAQITPPVGFNLFVIQSMTEHDILYIARAAAPNFMLMILMLFLVWMFPQIALYLPTTL